VPVRACACVRARFIGGGLVATVDVVMVFHVIK